MTYRMNKERIKIFFACLTKKVVTPYLLIRM
nr:MAG TPA: hypothetical protein [Bacteriophage sp.]